MKFFLKQYLIGFRIKSEMTNANIIGKNAIFVISAQAGIQYKTQKGQN
jgi:hypothetical protein